MKQLLKTGKWLAGQLRPFVWPMLLNTGLGIFLSLISVGIALVSRALIDAAFDGQQNDAIKAAVLFAALILTQTGLQVVVTTISVRITERVTNRIRQSLFGKLLGTRWIELTGFHSGDILTRLTNDVGVVAGGLVEVLPDMVALGVQLVAAFAALLVFDPVLAVLAFVLSPVAILASRLLGRKLKQLHHRIQESESRCSEFIQEAVQNMLVLKAFSLEKSKLGDMKRLLDEKQRWIFRRSWMSTVSGAIFSLGYWAGYLFAFLWGAMRLAAGAITIGTLTAFVQLVEHIHTPFVGMAHMLPQLTTMVASAARLMELESIPGEEEEETSLQWPGAGVCLQEVSYAYQTGNPVLQQISLEVEPGEWVALVGGSGEGKSTLTRLMLSLLGYYDGHIFFTDGKGARIEAGAASRSLIAYVPQGNMLFSGTIADNLMLGKAGASDKELEGAARAACAWEFICLLPEGMHTHIGERGVGLSEGQIQRLAIARALLRQAPILILDEATSALDIHTEKQVLRAIRKMSPTRTCILITHRVSALQLCSRVLKLEGGRIEEYGSPATAGQAIPTSVPGL